MHVALQIFVRNILPIFILVTLGCLIGRKFQLDTGTLNKINFWLLVPAFTFTNLYVTDIGIDALRALAVAALILCANLLTGFLVARARGYRDGLGNAFQNAIAFYNSGNIGIPLVTLVFSSGAFLVGGKSPYLDVALTTQIMVLVVQNVSVNTIGFFNAGRANRHWKDAVRNVVGMPAIYAVTAAFLVKLVPFDLTATPLWPALTYLRNGLVPIALTILGIQLAKTRFRISNRTAWLAVFLRLIGGPLLALVFIRLLGITGVVAQTLLISSAVPTAVNSALVALECDNHPDFATQVVVLSTLFGSFTLIGAIYMASVLYPV